MVPAEATPEIISGIKDAVNSIAEDAKLFNESLELGTDVIGSTKAEVSSAPRLCNLALKSLNEFIAKYDMQHKKSFLKNLSSSLKNIRNNKGIKNDTNRDDKTEMHGRN